MNSANTQKWYKKTGYIILFLIIFFPVGLFLMWKYTDWNKNIKIAISAIFVILIAIPYWYILLILGVIGIAICFIYKKKKSNSIDNANIEIDTTTIETNIEEVSVDVQEEKSTTRKITVDAFFNKVENDVLKYKYDERMYFIGDFEVAKSNIAEELVFKNEPENEYDPNAIALYIGEHKLGYVLKGMIQDMIHDWLKKGFEISAYLSSVENSEVRYIIGFYKPAETFNCKTFKLTKTSKKINEYTKRSDNALYISEGENVSFEWNDESESYVVYSNTYDEIGELPVSANELIDSTKRCVAVIDECDFSDTCIIKVSVYY